MEVITKGAMVWIIKKSIWEDLDGWNFKKIFLASYFCK